MDIDNLLDQVEGTQQDLPAQQDNKMKERLVQVVASGKSKEYLGKLYNTEEIDKLDEKQITQLYARYEAILGGRITQSLKQHMIFAYTRAVEAICPTVSQGRLAIRDTKEMCKSLNEGPFIDVALSSLTCKLYHDYGHLLAPLEAALLTSNYIQPANVQQQQPVSQQTTQLTTKLPGQETLDWVN